jgi:hypothetical protein
VDANREATWAAAKTIEGAAGELVKQLYQDWKGEAALVRVYASSPFAELHDKRRSFALGAAPQLQPAHVVLSLMGSHGADPDWQDVYRSRGHLAIPLLDEKQVETIPMMHALFQALGSPLADVGKVRRMIGGGDNALFYVADAATERDAKGRAIVPASEFVQRYGIKAVIAGGGRYLAGSFLCVIAFFRTSIDRPRADRIAVQMAAFKTAMTRRVRDGQLFES